MIYLQLLATLLMIGMNTLAVTLPLGGVSTGDLSDTLSTLITPAGFTFSIWSVIYLSMIVISLLIALKKITLPKITLSRYVISCVCNGLWIVAWHYGNLHLAMLLMLGLLVSLVMVDRSMKVQTIKWYQYVRSGFLFYLGWIIVASLLMTLIYGKYQLGIIGGFEKEVAIVALIIVAVLAILVIQKEKNVMTTLVALWALYGIQQNNLHSGIDDDIWLACTLLLVLLSLYLFAFIFKISKKGGLN